MNDDTDGSMNGSMSAKPTVAVVSACLLGRACRYDGASKGNADVLRWQARQLAAGASVIAVCPEELGDLGTPRPAAELSGGDGAAAWRSEATVRRVQDHHDVTAALQRGAQRALALAPSVTVAMLKARSPSCGVGRTHIDGAARSGDGVFAALLWQRGVVMHTEEDRGDVEDAGR